MRLAGKSIIVTGAAGGIGEGIARRLAEEGARVIVDELDAARGEQVAASIAQRGGDAAFFRADVTQSDAVRPPVGFAMQRHGCLDVMVNNPGWTHRNQNALNVTEAEFDRCYAVKVKSNYHTTLAVVPVFRAQGGHSFINIASTAGVRPRPGLTWYNGCESAVIITSKSLAAELGPDNIRVSCINPVFNPTNGLGTEFAGGELTEERLTKFRATIPPGRFSTALDVANGPGSSPATRPPSSSARALRWTARAACEGGTKRSRFETHGRAAHARSSATAPVVRRQPNQTRAATASSSAVTPHSKPSPAARGSSTASAGSSGL